MVADHSGMKLGLRPPRLGLAAPTMKRLGVALPKAAPVINWGRAVQSTRAWGMDLNDQIGDCTIAAVDHAQRLWHANCGAAMRVPTRAELVAAYSRVSGYDPTDPDTDRGAVWSDVLTAWTRDGFTLGGARDQAAAFVRVAPDDENELRLAIQWFGCALVGLAMPVSGQTQTVWDAAHGPDGEPGSWGGHAVTLVGYDPRASPA